MQYGLQRPPWDAPTPNDAPPDDASFPDNAPPKDTPSPDALSQDTPSPDAPPIAENASQTAAPLSADWNVLLTQCGERLPPMYRSFLNQCGGVTFAEGTLTLYAPDSLTMGRLNNERVKDVLQGLSGAERVIVREGTPPPVTIPPESQQKNRDELVAQSRQFPGVVTIIE